VPLNILLADDSIPAQNMGKKILVDAGYHVLTVSNGLEALRRIAEAIPDIAILDIFMPGYTGLELCERLRANAATATLPVILTVGKLEPYRPSDGEHVHSNAVIVKPFAAAELISAVRNLIGEPPVAQAEPEHAGALLAMDAETDPLAESRAAAGIVAPPTLSVADPTAPTETAAGGLPDEPLFSYGGSSVPGEAAPLIAPEASVYAGGPLATGDELGGAESLIFNPDAKHVPFSASAADVLSPASEIPAEDTPPSFGEFDLEMDASPYAAETDPEFSITEEPISAAPAAAVQDEGFAEEVAVSAVDAAPAEAEWPTVSHAGVTAAEEVVSSAPAEEQPESAAMEIAGIDPLLEVQDASTGSEAASFEDGGQAAKEIPGESAPAREQAFAGFAAEQLAQDEEARRLAFEALFNSTELIPLEENPAPPATLPIDVLPSIANASKDQHVNAAPDLELEPLDDHSHSALPAPEPDPYLIEEEQPLHAVGEIPDRDPLLDDGEASNWRPQQRHKPEGAIATDSGGVYPAQPEDGGDVTAAVEVITVEAPEALAESHPEAVDLPVAAPVVESAPMVFESAPESAQTAEETAPEPLEEMATEPRLLTESDSGALEILAAALAAESAPMACEATAEPAQAAVEAAPAEAVPLESQQTAAVPVAEPAAVEVITVEAPEALAESHPEALEVLEAAPAAESAPVVFEEAQEAAETEAVAAPVQLEAEPAVEPLHVEPLYEPQFEAEQAPVAESAAVEVITVEAPKMLAEPHPEALEVLETAPAAESAPVVFEMAQEPAETEVEAVPVQLEAEPAVEPPHVEPLYEPQFEVEQAPVAPISALAEAVHRQAAMQVETLDPAAEVSPRSNDPERIHQAVERVFDRYRPVLIAAIVRELIRQD
jgi:CheY-like chemotaxis protein